MILYFLCDMLLTLLIKAIGPKVKTKSYCKLWGWGLHDHDEYISWIQFCWDIGYVQLLIILVLHNLIPTSCGFISDLLPEKPLGRLERQPKPNHSTAYRQSYDATVNTSLASTLYLLTVHGHNRTVKARSLHCLCLLAILWSLTWVILPVVKTRHPTRGTDTPPRQNLAPIHSSFLFCLRSTYKQNVAEMSS